MALVNKTFSVNVTPGEMPPIVHVSEYDVGRAYTVSILDEQGNTFTIPSGTTASIEGTLNGSVGFTKSATVSNNQVSFTLSQDMTAYSGKAWCKIKLTQNSQPIQTCAFILAVDRAGVEADTVIGAPGFQEQINQGVAEYFDNDPPFFELPSGGQRGQALVSDGQGGGVWGVKPFQLPSGGQSGQALLSDGSNGAYWGQAQGGGSGLTDEVKSALMNVASHIGAWTVGNAQTYIQALYDALYPVTNLVSISAVFVQGGVVIVEGASLDSLKPYLTVTAHYDDSTTETITDYTLSGTLTAGISTITVLYGGKTTTFNVNVHGNPYQYVEYVETDGASRIDTGVQFDGTKDIEVTVEASFSKPLTAGQNTMIGWSAGGAVGVVFGNGFIVWTDGADNPSSTHLTGINLMTEINMVIQAGSATNTISTFTNTNGTKTLTRAHTNVENRTFLPFPLFALSLQDSFDYTLDGFRIKSAIIKVGGTVVRNLKACYRKSDNVIGFFDETNSVFYTNAGTGTFTKGGDIS